MSLSKTKSRQLGSTLTSKSKIEIAPITMKFRVISPNRKGKPKNRSNGNERSSSFYDNYQPLNMLYKKKTKQR